MFKFIFIIKLLFVMTFVIPNLSLATDVIKNTKISGADALRIGFQLIGIEYNEKLLNSLSSSSSSEVEINQDNTPFLSTKLQGRTKWLVQVSDTISDYVDKENNIIKYLISLDSETGELIKIEAESKGNNFPKFRPEPSVQEKESALLVNSQRIISFVNDKNVVPLKVILSNIKKNPLKSKYMNAICVYVQSTSVDSKPEPMWIITFRGTTPLKQRSTFGGKIKTIPEEYRSTVIYRVNAVTGTPLFHTNESLPFNREKE